MIGQGRPTASTFHGCQARLASLGCQALLAVALCLACRSWAAASEAETVRVRIAWGGGAARTWTGSLTVDQGELRDPQLLGIEADEPGSMWLSHENRRLEIRQRSPRTYDGVDLLVAAPAHAVLQLRLTPADAPDHTAEVAVSVAELLEDAPNEQLDDRGNRVLMQRSPGDALRVSFDRTSLVFASGESFDLTVEPHLLALADDARFVIKLELTPARGTRVLWSVEREGRAGQAVAFPIHVPLPTEEGAYDLTLTAARSGWPNPVRRPLYWRQTVAERKVQVLVLGAGPPIPAAANEESALRQVVEIDPAHPRWWEVLAKLPQLPKIQRLWKAPLGNGNMQRWEHPLGELVRLNPSGQSPDRSWEAYTLPIVDAGRPHILEVEYPNDVPQTLGISVLEPNAAGALMPIGLDSGVEVVPPPLGADTPQWQQHRIVFWPRTTSPMVLMTNLRADDPAVYGKIRVLAVGARLPEAAIPSSPNDRLLAAYMDRPMLPENFSAQESFDAAIERGLDDWQAFHEAGSRLVEYLEYAGYNGLMLNVLADGSTVYPSRLLQPTPRYDTGVLFTTAQDPVRKDVLEMLFRMFNRHGLRLIPGLEFGARLPALEETLRRGGPDAEGIEWIGPQGTAWQGTHRTHRGLGAYYNVLHPRVQEAMLDVVHEAAGRYAHHPSFAGLAVQLSAHGYTQLPGPEWGLDDATIARFSSDTGTSVPGEGPNRFEQRAQFLASEPQQTVWLRWRAERLHAFHRRLKAELTALRPEADLYLAGAEMLSGDALSERLRPTLIGRPSIADVFLSIGIDPERYRKTGEPVLMRTERYEVGGRSTLGAVGKELTVMPEFDRMFEHQHAPTVLFYQPPHKSRVGSFDAKSPFQPSYTSLFAQISPSGHENRKRFVNAMAKLDPTVVCDGGWLLPLGQEAALRDFAAAYRRLPAVPFHRVEEYPWPSQPVVFRYAHYEGHTYAYAVNNAPFAVETRIRIEAPAGCRLEELSGARSLPPLRQDGRGVFVWEMQLRPYDLVAVRLNTPDARLLTPEAVIPAEVRTAFEQRIRSLGQRAAVLRGAGTKPVVENPGFERPVDTPGEIPGWASTRNRPGVDVRLDAANPRTGGQCVRMTSQEGIAVLVSRPFDAPATGRLTMSVWLRVPDGQRQPPLRLAIEGDFGRIPYRFASVGSSPGAGQPAVPITTQWAQYVFHVPDLPLEPGRQVSVRFDLMGAGDVFIDDVEVYDLSFNRNELIELSKHISLIDVKLQNGLLSDCLGLLESYWPRFLEEHVPLPAGSHGAGNLADRPSQPRKPPAASTQTDSGERTSLLDRMRGLVPKKFW